MATEMSNIEGRLSTVEANYERLHEDVQSLSKKIDYGIDSIRKQISDVVTDRADQRKPQWGLLISSVGLVITFMVLAFTPLIYGFQMQQAEIKRHEDILDQRGMLIGQIRNELPSLEGDISHLDEVLQREMRLLDDSMLTQLDGLKSSLGREMELMHGQQKIEIENLKARLEP